MRPSQPPGLPVLILGKTITALGVLRVLRGHGLTCYAVDATSDLISRSRWYRPAERLLAETADSAELDRYLASLRLPGAVLIACSDKWTHAVAGLPPETRQRFPASVPPAEAVDQFLDKDRFRNLVNRLEIPHPRAIPLNTPADLDLASDEVLSNGFLKPTDSPRHNQLFGTKGSFIESRESARRLVEQAAAAGITFMVQEWIPGGMGATILIDGFVDRHGSVEAMMARRRLRMNPARLGNTTAAVTIPLHEVSQATVGLRRLLADVAYRGVFNVEFKFDARDGLYKIIEVNPRPAWFIATIARMGLDLPWMAWLDAQDRPVPQGSRYRVGRYGVYETPDVAALARAWGSFRRADGPVLRPWVAGYHALFSWTDPGPALFDLGRAFRGRVSSLLGRAPAT